MTAAVVIGHESGFSWDEAVLLLIPIVAVGAVIFALERRRRRFPADDEASDGGD